MDIDKNLFGEPDDYIVDEGVIACNFFKDEKFSQEDTARFSRTISPKFVTRCNTQTIYFEGNSTPPVTEYTSLCTLSLKDPDKLKHVYIFPELISEEDNTKSIITIEIESTEEQTSKLKWVAFCETLFPKIREYTKQESEAYSNFINSYFEKV